MASAVTGLRATPSPWSLLAAPALLLALALPRPAQALDVDLGQNVDFSTWTLLGAARTYTTPALAYPGGPVVGIAHELVLTDAVSDSVGAGFAPDTLRINFNQDFSFRFQAFLYGSDIRGDGMSFVLTTQTTPALGGGGSDLGYGGSGMPGYAFAIDTFDFPGQPESPSLQILRDGSATPVAYTETGLGDDIRNLQSWSVEVRYTASGNNDETGLLEASIFRPDLGSFSVRSAADWSVIGSAETDPDTGDYLGRRVLYGFTVSNGLASDGHLVTSLAPVPEPSTYAMLLAGLALMVSLVGRRSVSRRAM
jgi:hypothetical protein